MNGWHHIAVVGNGTTLTLYLDGQAVETNGSPLPAAATGNGSGSPSRSTYGTSNQHFKIGAGVWSGNSTIPSLSGQISDVRIWNTARTTDEINNNKYLQLTGREVGLLGYWRLDAIFESENERKVIDFAVDGHDGVVNGEAYVSAVTLQRNLDGTTPAIKYENEELFAVAERATYIEEFEFKTDVTSNSDIFVFTYKGKKNRNSQNWIDIESKSIIKRLENTNWYTARSTFTVPDGVSMVRSFGIGNIKGSWTTLNIRKHRIQLVSNSITEATHTENVSGLTILSDNQLQLQESLKQLGKMEQKEAEQLKEKKRLEVNISTLSLSGPEKQTAIDSKNKEIREKTSEIAALQAELARLQARHRIEQENPLNYWCKLVNGRDASSAARIENNQLVYTDHTACIDFKFVETDLPGCYRIIWPYGGDSRQQELELYGSPSPDRKVYGVFAPTGHGYQWIIDRVWGEPNCYIIANRTTNEILMRGTGNNSSKVLVGPSYQPTEGDFRRYWKIIKTGGATNQKISNALEDVEKQETLLTKANTKLSELQDQRNALELSKDDRDAQKTRSETALTRVISELTKLQTELNTLNTELIHSITTSQQSPQKMSILQPGIGDLETTGALLGFVRPASRISVIETCEGNVQLSYFDDQGRMRQTNFDATYDSMNATGEQWIVDSLRTCLNFDKPSSVVTLTTPVSLGEEWTIEAWFACPLPETRSKWHTLCEGKNGDAHIRIKDGKWLGTWTGQNFYDSGFNIESLSTGWHHLTVVRRSSNTLSYYIDGAQVGTEERVMQFDGTHDVGRRNYVEVTNSGTINFSVNQDFTVEAWVNVNPTRQDGRQGDNSIIGKWSGSQGYPYVISYRNTDRKIVAARFDGTNAPAIVSAVSIDDRNFHHVAFVKQGSQLRLYIDGDCSIKGGTTQDTTTGNTQNNSPLYLGCRGGTSNFFGGQISEVRIWNKARTQEEIRATMNQRLNGNETNLVAYYPLNETQQQGTNRRVLDSVANNHGTVTGATINPTKTLSFKSFDSSGIKDICAIGNSANTFAERFGKVAEVRVWGVALNAEEIAVSSKTLLTGNEPGLLAYYPFNEATGTDVRDQTGNGNNGKIVGASWWGCAAPIGDLGYSVVKPQMMQFSGANAYIDLGEEIRVNSKFTQEVWIYSTITDNAYHGVLGNQPAGGVNHRPPSIWVYEQNKICVSFGNGTQVYTLRTDVAVLVPNQWNHIAVTFDGSTCIIYVNGQLKQQGSSSFAQLANTSIRYIGKVDNWFQGKVSEVRIWNQCRTEAEIKANMNNRLTGKEAGLVGYWQLDHIIAEGSPSKVSDLVNNRHGIVNQAILVSDQNIPITIIITSDAVVCSEYSTISQDRTAMMRRFFAVPTSQGVELLADKRVEELELKWIGNGQFAPTLVGYIEGPPPIPSENLTLEQNYNGATSVELALSEDMAFKWTRSNNTGLGSSIDFFVGTDVEQSFTVEAFGVGTAIKSTGIRAGVKGNSSSKEESQRATSITASSSLKMANTLKLCGTQEQTPHFPHLGKRFIPKNVGYALVTSALADVFIMRLQRTKKMISYQVLPVENIPPDVNTITFLINPAYTMSGSLDGMTGSSATSQRFFKHVPEMRAKYGSLYPASHYRLQEAYALKQKIEQQDKARESYFCQFNARLVDEASLERETDKGNAPEEISVSRAEAEPDANLSEEQKKAKQGEVRKKLEDQAEAAKNQQSAAVTKKQAEIDKLIKDPNLRANATASFANWQKKMEDIQIRAGKRNIVNTYVWDADGGLRTESQSFANTVEHSIGASVSLDGAIGLEGNFTIGGGAQELTQQATICLTQTMSKTETRSKGIQLNVDLSGVESRGITGYNDYPILPAEKVGRYRFMSFYLEGNTNHFHDFFSYVVDPEWLASNSEEARALRQARGKANKAWRVLHRVTYVERPALMGFGRDLRQLPPANSVNELEQIQDKVKALEKSNDEIQRKLDAILKKLSS